MKALIRWGNLIFFIAMVIVNILANTIPLGGNTTGDVSANYPTLFTPAPYTFSIWGVIYIMMGIFVVYTSLIFPSAKSAFAARNHVGIFFILSCMFNIAWIFTWHYQKFALSVLCIIGLLLMLIIINIRFKVYSDIPVMERICVYGFQIYLGWICAATIANIGVLLKKINWTGFGLSDQLWTIIVLLITCILGCAFATTGCRYMASVAILWALAGIFVKHISATGYANAYPVISIVVACVFNIILLCMLLTPFFRGVFSSPESDEQHYIED